MADFRLGRLKFNWRGPWQASTVYVIDDIITFGGNSYTCVVNHTSASNQTAWYSTDFDIVTPRWQLHTAGVDYLGSWTVSTFYSINDIVTFGGVAYICTNDHTSAANQTNFETTDIGYWDVFVAGFNNRGAWNTATFYRINDIATWGSTVYICINDHTSAANQTNFETTDIANWQVLTTGLNNRGNWGISTFYRINDTAKYGANVYRCVNDHTSSGNQNLFYSTDLSNWILFTEGQSFLGDWTPTTWFKLNDVVRYGNNLYITTTGHTSTSTFDPTKFSAFLDALKFEDIWNSGTEYQPGDIVTYGGYAYVSNTIHTNKPPNLNTPTDWEVITTGFKALGTWSAGTYKPGDVVIFGGDTYVANSTTAQAPSNTAVWDRITEGLSFVGNWSNSTTYKRHEVVRVASTTYISVVQDNFNIDPTTDLTGTFWQVLASGDSNNLLTANGDLLVYSGSGAARFPIGQYGSVLTANSTGFPEWKINDEANNVYYVSKSGSDTNDGKSLSKAFLTIDAALTAAPNNSAIFVKSGSYEERLPLILKNGQSIVGDGLRTTIIHPAPGLNKASTANNNVSTMFLMGDATMIKFLSMRDMTGFQANTGATPDDITTAANNSAGIFLAFDPAAPILTKSPYVADCTAISVGGIGAKVDGTVHASGNRTMVFHAFTQIHDGGVGFWCKDRGGAEIVSCFTYYNHIGYTSTGGGKIRGLNGNNSYGNYGAVSVGFDTTEVPTTGVIYGTQLTIKPGVSGNVVPGDILTGTVSGATATITNSQIASNKIYVKMISGAFQQDEAFTTSGGGGGSLLNNSDYYGNQKGFILVLSGLNYEPVVGGSISLVGDPFSYVVQAVTGTYVNSSSIITVVLAGEKPTGSADGTVATIRYKYSQVRLTGHDFLSIGTGNKTTSNYPGDPLQPPVPGNEIIEKFPGRVYYVSTDQDGNFRVGEYFRIDQATGRATLNASAFDLSGLSSLRLGSIGAQLGEQINEFSSDSTMGGNSNLAVPTEFAVKQFVENSIRTSASVTPIDDISSLFDGVTRTFTLTTSNTSVIGANVTAVNPYNINVLLGGVRVYPTSETSRDSTDYVYQTQFGSQLTFKDGFYLSGASNNVITFYNPPRRGTLFYGTVTSETRSRYSVDINSKYPFAPLNIMSAD